MDLRNLLARLGEYDMTLMANTIDCIADPSETVLFCEIRIRRWVSVMVRN
jgi:hypothetical protein